MAQATLNWTLVSTRDDGSPLAPTDIAFTGISMSADGGASFGPEAQVLPTEAQEFVVDGLVPGTYIFRGVVQDVDGRRSGDAEASGSVLAAPSAIADLTVTITE